MKDTIKKIFITLAGLIVSFAACIQGMYMVSLADMKFIYMMLFSAVFMFNPLTTILMAVYMFRRPKAAAEKQPKEEKPAKEKKQPKEFRNPFKKKPKETDESYEEPDFGSSSWTEPKEGGSSHEEPDFGVSLKKDSDAHTDPLPSPEKEAAAEDEKALFSGHVTADEEDQFVSGDTGAVKRKRISL